MNDKDNEFILNRLMVQIQTIWYYNAEYFQFIMQLIYAIIFIPVSREV